MFGGTNYYQNIVVSIEKYSPETNTWEFVADMMDDRMLFSACSFMDNVYIMGGRFNNGRIWQNKATCFEFNTKSLDWKEISRMSNARRDLACSVFEGRIVVSGGSNIIVNLNTV